MKGITATANLNVHRYKIQNGIQIYKNSSCFKEKEHVFDYAKIWGERGFIIQYTIDDFSHTYFTKENKIVLPYDDAIKEIQIIPTFENKKDVQGTPYSFVL